MLFIWTTFLHIYKIWIYFFTYKKWIALLKRKTKMALCILLPQIFLKSQMITNVESNAPAPFVPASSCVNTVFKDEIVNKIFDNMFACFTFKSIMNIIFALTWNQNRLYLGFQHNSFLFDPLNIILNQRAFISIDKGFISADGGSTNWPFVWEICDLCKTKKQSHCNIPSTLFCLFKNDRIFFVLFLFLQIVSTKSHTKILTPKWRYLFICSVLRRPRESCF